MPNIPFNYILSFTLLSFIFPSLASASIIQFIPESSNIKSGVYMTLEDFKEDIYSFNILKNGISPDIRGLSMDIVFDINKVEIISSSINIMNNIDKIITIEKVFNKGFSLAVSSISNQNLIFADNNVIAQIEMRLNDNEVDFEIDNLVVVTEGGDIFQGSGFKSYGGKIKNTKNLPTAGIDKLIMYLIIFITFVILFFYFFKKKLFLANSKQSAQMDQCTSKIYSDLSSNLLTKKTPYS